MALLRLPGNMGIAQVDERLEFYRYSGSEERLDKYLVTCLP
jgi:hypothetical protein